MANVAGIRVVISTSIMAVIGATTATAAAQSPEDAPGRPIVMAPDARVRGVSPRIVALIDEGAARSRTFHTLVEEINGTDGIVYVAEGTCGHEVRACLLFSITTTGANRVLRILVDSSKTDPDLIASVGHELQHAFEVLSIRYIRTDAAMALLYRRIGRTVGRRLETDAALNVGAAVRKELRRNTLPTDEH